MHALVKAASHGDVEAFAELVRSYSNSVCAVAYGILRDYHLAQDVAQETFVKAFSSLHTLQDPDKFGSWIYSIATRLSIDWKRKQDRQARLGQKLLSNQPLHTTEEGFKQKEMRMDIWSALDQLDKKNRAILLLYYVCEKPMAEIGKLLHLSVNAVDSRLRRNRKLMRDEILAAWADQFGAASREAIVTEVVKRIIKQAGQYYIPVTSRSRSTEWFSVQFGLPLDTNGHLKLPMGHTLFLIEVEPDVMAAWTDSDLPVLVFHVDDAVTISEVLSEQGVRVEMDESGGFPGYQVHFFDPDGNKFGLFSEK